MQEYSLLISKIKLQDRTILGGNLDFDYVLPHVYVSQDLDLVPVLGQALMDDLMAKVKDEDENQTPISANDQLLLDRYITPFLAHAIIVRALPSLAIKLVDSGVVQRVTDDGTPLSMEDIDKLIMSYEVVRDPYKQQLIDYLCYNDNLYPTFKDSKSWELGPSDYNYNLGIGLTRSTGAKAPRGSNSSSSSPVIITFIGLPDTPSTYSGQSGKVVSVKATEDGVEFTTPLGGGNLKSDGTVPMDGGYTPSADQQIGTKKYTDDSVSGKVNKSGDTMTGDLILNAAPTVDLQAATKKYVDDNSGSGEANTSSNDGTGEGLAKTKVGVNLPFKSIVAGERITMTSDDDEITINADEAESVVITAKVNEASGISAGQVCFLSGATGGFPQVSLADNTDFSKSDVLAIANESKTNGQNILITLGGLLEDLDTSAFIEGDILYLGTVGNIITTHPDPLRAVVRLGEAVKINATTGSIIVTMDSLTKIDDFDGTVRQQMINLSDANSASVAFSVLNDLSHRVSMSLTGSGHATSPEQMFLFNQGYGMTNYFLDGNQPHVWFTDVTDAHTFAATEKMRLSAIGDLSLLGKLPEKNLVGPRSTNAAVTGATSLDWNAFKVFEFGLTGNTTLSDTNLPTGTDTKVIEMIVTGDFTLAFPSYYEALPSNDSYDGTKRNHIVISCINGTGSSEDVLYSLQTLS